ncbi:MAG: sugar ABC transporter permease [Thermoprotei archaeon]|nr:MAG: sugar ABC transporter permease [Thermoprotei archaeon]
MGLPAELTGRLLLLPALVLIGLFVIFPVAWGVYISFTDMTLVGPKAVKYGFVMFKNYLRLLADPDFWNSLRVSFLFTVFSALIGQASLGLALALVLRMEGIKGKTAVALVVFIAWIIPEVVAGFTWGSFAMKWGYLNAMLDPIYRLLGMKYINWLYEKPLETIIIANIWRGTAFSMILFTAALESIPKFLYEAAEVDGASSWQKFRYITFPLLSYAILIDFILITIWTFMVFTMIYVMTGGGPGTATELWTIFVYKRAFTPPYTLGYAAAAANIMFMIVLALIVTYLVMIRRIRW